MPIIQGDAVHCQSRRGSLLHCRTDPCLVVEFPMDQLGLVLGRGLKSLGTTFVMPFLRSVVTIPRSEQP